MSVTEDTEELCITRSLDTVLTAMHDVNSYCHEAKRLVNDEDRMASSWCTFKVVGFTVILYVTNVTTSKI